MNQLVLHPQTDLKLKSYLQNPTHALLLTGEEGSGKLHLAHWLASEQKLATYIVEPEEEKSVITIEQIRSLYNLTRTGNPLLVVIKDAQNLGLEAQNAFLKLLEEPPAMVKFVLTASSAAAILPTIRSRVQELRVTPPTKELLVSYAQNNYSVPSDELGSLIYVSKQLPGKLIAQLEDQELRSTQQSSTAEAKKFYGSSPYERHLICLVHTYDREWIQTLLDTLSLIVSSLFRTAPSKAATKKLLSQAGLIEEAALHALHQNGNPKIHLARLCQQL